MSILSYLLYMLVVFNINSNIVNIGIIWTFEIVCCNFTCNFIVDATIWIIWAYPLWYGYPRKLVNISSLRQIAFYIYIYICIMCISNTCPTWGSPSESIKWWVLLSRLLLPNDRWARSDLMFCSARSIVSVCKEHCSNQAN